MDETFYDFKKNIINLQDKTTALKGTVEKYWFENKNIQLKKTLFHNINIPLKPFDSGIDYESQPIETSLVFEWLNLGITNPYELNKIEISSNKYSDLEASIYLGNVHNKIEVESLFFEKIDENNYKVTGKIRIDFENELLAKNENFNFETSLELPKSNKIKSIKNTNNLMKEKIKKNWKLFLIASLTLGLAPFNPPHIWGKIQWILGGNAFSGENAMKGQDYFDVLLHGLPWILLLISVILNLLSKLAKTDQE